MKKLSFLLKLTCGPEPGEGGSEEMEKTRGKDGERLRRPQDKVSSRRSRLTKSPHDPVCICAIIINVVRMSSDFRVTSDFPSSHFSARVNTNW